MRGRKGGGDFVDFAKIEKAAQDALDRFGYKGTGAVEIVELAKNEGFIVGEALLEDHSDGMILVNMKEKKILGHETKKIILVNRELDGYFKRFVIAHELGHYFLDRDNQKKDYILAHRDTRIRDDDDHEKEMDYFAACLLMPSATFRQVRDVAASLFDENYVTTYVVKLLSNFFKVPERSVERRLKEVAG